VWGGIVLLLVLVAFQARARFGYTMTLKALQERLGEDEGENAKPLLVADLDQYLVGWPSKTVDEKSKHVGVIDLKWPGLTQSFGLTVSYDPSEPTESDGTVMSVESTGYVEPPPEAVEAPQAAQGPSGPAAPGAPRPVSRPEEEGDAAPTADAEAGSADAAQDSPADAPGDEK
jgi:hypothetical protein